MLVLLLLLRNGCVGSGFYTACVGPGWVIVAGVDFEVVGEGEELGYGVVSGFMSDYKAEIGTSGGGDTQLMGITVGKIAPGGADVIVEDGVAAEDVRCFAHAVRVREQLPING